MLKYGIYWTDKRINKEILTWSLPYEYINKFYCAWRKCVRRVWNLPNQTHCVFLEHRYGHVNIDMQLLRRFTSFYYCAMYSKNQE